MAGFAATTFSLLLVVASCGTGGTPTRAHPRFRSERLIPETEGLDLLPQRFPPPSRGYRFSMERREPTSDDTLLSEALWGLGLIGAVLVVVVLVVALGR